MPAKADLKSLVWYSPGAFEEKGYEVPETMEDLLTTADEMIAAGDTPFCVGIGSDAATGWPMTDWIEDFMLRLKGPEVYDQWVNHEIPFDDPDVVEVVQYVYDLWATDGMARRGRGERTRPTFGWDGLTDAERRVAHLAAEGLTNPQIAERLVIGRETVKSHMTAVLRKVGLRNRTELARAVRDRDVAAHDDGG